MNNIEKANDTDLAYMKRLVWLSHAFMYMCVAMFLYIFILSVFVDGSWLENLAFPVIICVLLVPIFALIWWPFRYVSADYKAGEKAVETTTIERLQKVGFFEMQADSALGIMAGAIYYLWIPDETRTPPHRRFRIGLTTYQQLMLYGNGTIEIAYLPKSGIILSIDTPDYRYAAWEPSDKRHQYKNRRAARG